MWQVITGILIAVVSGIILSALGIGSRTTVRVQGGQRVTKKWKVMIALGWLMFVGGGYYCIAWTSAVGFTDPRPGIGLSVGVLGFFLLIIGKFGAWWNRSW